MSLEAIRDRLLDDQILDKVLHVTEDAELECHDLLVLVDTTDAAIAVTLMPVSMMAGKTVAIHLVTKVSDLTVQDRDDSFNWEGDYTLNAANEVIVLLSDGIKWHLVASYGWAA